MLDQNQMITWRFLFCFVLRSGLPCANIPPMRVGCWAPSAASPARDGQLYHPRRLATWLANYPGSSYSWFCQDIRSWQGCTQSTVLLPCTHRQDQGCHLHLPAGQSNFCILTWRWLHALLLYYLFYQTLRKMKIKKFSNKKICT